MLYTDRLKLIKAMIKAKEDDDTIAYMGGIKMGNMSYGGIPINYGDEHEFEREEIVEFILEEIQNLEVGQTMRTEEKLERLKRAKGNQERTEAKLAQIPKYRFIKRNKMKSELEDYEVELERAQLLVDMRQIEPRHIQLLKQIEQLLEEQENGKNRYKRKDIKKYINYAIYRIEQQEKGLIHEDDISQHSFFEKLRVTGDKIKEGHYGENARIVIQDWSLNGR